MKIDSSELKTSIEMTDNIRRAIEKTFSEPLTQEKYDNLSDVQKLKCSVGDRIGYFLLQTILSPTDINLELTIVSDKDYDNYTLDYELVDEVGPIIMKVD